MRIAIAILACLLTIWAVQTFAEPAPWYWWQSKSDGHRICQQYSPGEGWLKAGGPYRDAGCRLVTSERSNRGEMSLNR